MVHTAFNTRFTRETLTRRQQTGDYGVAVSVDFVGHCSPWSPQAEPRSYDFMVVGNDYSRDRFRIQVAESKSRLPDLDKSGWTSLVKAITTEVEQQIGRHVTSNFGPSYILDARDDR